MGGEGKSRDREDIWKGEKGRRRKGRGAEGRTVETLPPAIPAYTPLENVTRTRGFFVHSI